MARLLGVSRSGFYAWLKRGPSDRAVRQAHIEQKVCWFHGASDEAYGSPKILADLRDDGEIISRKTVAKVMRRLGLRGISPQRWKTTTLIDHADAYPVGQLPEQVIFHTDRGTQYATAQITAFAAANGITRSMGYTGVCWDCQSVSVGSDLDSEVLAVAA